MNEADTAKVLSHPLRPVILNALDGRTASPSVLAKELKVPLGTMAYHVRQLHDMQMVKLVKRTPRRGAVEHHYRALVRVKMTVKPIKED